MALDEIDAKILKKMLKDARMSYRKIADEINVSPPTVLSRVQKLKSRLSNHILQYLIIKN
jgi:Lrp/AsnC family leucine-responsive transcriptional regulator